MGRQIGYARVSTDDLHGKAQKAALHAVPCDLVFFEQESGDNRERPELTRALKELRSGDTLVVARLERLGRSLIHLLQIMEDLEARGIAFRSLAEGFDMRTDEGQLMMQQLGSFAEFERKRITPDLATKSPTSHDTLLALTQCDLSILHILKLGNETKTGPYLG